jgi:hypothetical protein
MWSTVISGTGSRNRKRARAIPRKLVIVLTRGTTSRRLGLGATVAATLVLLGGIAYATATPGGGNVIHALCVQAGRSVARAVRQRETMLAVRDRADVE